MNRTLAVILLFATTTLVACERPDVETDASDSSGGRHAEINAQVPSPPLVAAARSQIGITLRYDPAYTRLAYPGGDVPLDRGVCTDVIVRALRTRGLDLQQTIHEDMRAHFNAYPRAWSNTRPDSNIDHRRVPNLMRWFERQGWQRPLDGARTDYEPGDIVAWKLRGSGLLHIGIVSDSYSGNRTPLILHNIGAGTREDDLLFAHPIIGHYRPPRALMAATPQG